MIIKERGLNKRYKDLYDQKYAGIGLQQNWSQRIGNELVPVTLNDLITCFSIIIIGLISSGLLLCSENFYYYKKQKVIP